MADEAVSLLSSSHYNKRSEKNNILARAWIVCVTRDPSKREGARARAKERERERERETGREGERERNRKRERERERERQRMREIRTGRSSLTCKLCKGTTLHTNPEE